jgi:hypothetical protein
MGDVNRFVRIPCIGGDAELFQGDKIVLELGRRILKRNGAVDVDPSLSGCVAIWSASIAPSPSGSIEIISVRWRLVSTQALTMPNVEMLPSFSQSWRRV